MLSRTAGDTSLPRPCSRYVYQVVLTRREPRPPRAATPEFGVGQRWGNPHPSGLSAHAGRAGTSQAQPHDPMRLSQLPPRGSRINTRLPRLPIRGPSPSKPHAESACEPPDAIFYRNVRHGPMSRIARPTAPHDAHDAPGPSGFTYYPVHVDTVIIRAYYVMS